ncbi:hypothetical protein [Microbispora bryophytorum]|uniref:hypothetical protein n=1 Tax=Microbispora bryophytorum TaxID=1460882 RepID=UPI0037233251
MRQITINPRSVNQQAGILAALGDLLRSQEVRTRLISHITLRMTGLPVWDPAVSELDIYGLGGQVARSPSTRSTSPAAS